MCGRTCCTLSAACLPAACHTVTPSRPTYYSAPDTSSSYTPSTNVPPSKYTPVLCRGQQVDHADDAFVVQPMLWGLVPFWFKGENALSHGLTTNNARMEGLRESKLYKQSLLRNQRCVVVCDGFYEWQELKKGESGPKQPYLVYAPQPEGQHIEDMASFAKNWPLEAAPSGAEAENERVWSGPRPMFMAGLFSVWRAGANADQPVFSYTVITRESNSVFNWLHHRIPAILPDKASVQKWLDPEVQGFQALDVLQPIKKTQIAWHPVSREVGNSRNQGQDLAKPVELDKTGKPVDKKSGSSAVMTAWLKRGQQQKKEDGKDDVTEKKKSKRE